MLITHIVRVVLTLLAALLLGASTATLLRLHRHNFGEPLLADVALILLGLGLAAASGLLFSAGHLSAPVNASTVLSLLALSVGTVGVLRLLTHLRSRS